jgi:hypothetical protein
MTPGIKPKRLSKFSFLPILENSRMCILKKKKKNWPKEREITFETCNEQTALSSKKK